MSAASTVAVLALWAARIKQPLSKRRPHGGHRPPHWEPLPNTDRVTVLHVDRLRNQNGRPDCDGRCQAELRNPCGRMELEECQHYEACWGAGSGWVSMPVWEVGG